jgi:hypothetical protein
VWNAQSAPVIAFVLVAHFRSALQGRSVILGCQAAACRQQEPLPASISIHHFAALCRRVILRSLTDTPLDCTCLSLLLLVFAGSPKTLLFLCRRVILGCLAAAPPHPAGSPEAAAEAVATPPPAARSALRCLSLEAVWRLLLAARAAGGCAAGQRPAAAATPAGEVR